MTKKLFPITILCSNDINYKNIDNYFNQFKHLDETISMFVETVVSVKQKCLVN